jgi:hypothetical protein
MSRRPRGTFSPRQSRAARALLGWSPKELARRSRLEAEGARLRAPDAPSLPTAAPWWPAPRPPGASAPPPQLAAVNDDTGEDEDDDNSDLWGEEVDEFEREDG